jgi:predicted nucleic acid-binding protein
LPTEALPTIVLDTNAVLDAWLFRDPGMVDVLGALGNESMVWIATAAMREELVHTLKLPVLTAWQAEAAATVARFDELAALCGEPARTVHRRLWCSDHDDQVFLDLALERGARWLLTKDRALLKLGRHAKPFGVHIVPPLRWRSTPATPPVAARA